MHMENEECKPMDCGIPTSYSEQIVPLQPGTPSLPHWLQKQNINELRKISRKIGLPLTAYTKSQIILQLINFLSTKHGKLMLWNNLHHL